MRDRYLFSADRKATEYRTLLEITPGHARLLTPSAAAYGVRWAMSAIYMVLYVIDAGLLFGLLTTELTPPWLRGPLVLLAVEVLWWVGFLALFLGWDRTSLPLLAEKPAQVTDLVLVGAHSYGTYQDVRAHANGGQEFHLVVDARPRRFWEAVRLLDGTPAHSG